MPENDNTEFDMTPREIPVTSIKNIGIGKIATLIGRYYAMDRDNRWDRIEKAYDAIVNRQGEKKSSPYEAIMDSYSKEITDEFIKPVIIENISDGVKPNDSIVFFNFRPDRARQITRAFADPNLKRFNRKLITPLS